MHTLAKLQHLVVGAHFNQHKGALRVSRSRLNGCTDGAKRSLQRALIRVVAVGRNKIGLRAPSGLRATRLAPLTARVGNDMFLVAGVSLTAIWIIRVRRIARVRIVAVRRIGHGGVRRVRVEISPDISTHVPLPLRGDDRLAASHPQPACDQRYCHRTSPNAPVSAALLMPHCDLPM
ncbi:hypothetical protein DV096_01020 [Bradymonadaceae bacterium TMQ3]|nr:hypothetical protein DV096_01020 [Bradymonadaceae bacterium TMQ3]